MKDMAKVAKARKQIKTVRIIILISAVVFILSTMMVLLGLGSSSKISTGTGQAKEQGNTLTGYVEKDLVPEEENTVGLVGITSMILNALLMLILVPFYLQIKSYLIIRHRDLEYFSSTPQQSLTDFFNIVIEMLNAKEKTDRILSDLENIRNKKTSKGILRRIEFQKGRQSRQLSGSYSSIQVAVTRNIDWNQVFEVISLYLDGLDLDIRQIIKTAEEKSHHELVYLLENFSTIRNIRTLHKSN